MWTYLRSHYSTYYKSKLGDMYKMLITALFIREKTTTTNLRNNSKVYQL